MRYICIPKAPQSKALSGDRKKLRRRPPTQLRPPWGAAAFWAFGNLGIIEISVFYILRRSKPLPRGCHLYNNASGGPGYPNMDREGNSLGSNKRRLLPIAPAPASGSGQGAGGAGTTTKGRRQVTAACEACRRRKSKVRKEKLNITFKTGKIYTWHRKEKRTGFYLISY